MEKLDFKIGDMFQTGEIMLEVKEPENKISNCSGCYFCEPWTNSLHSECHAPQGLRCSFPSRIFKEVK